MEDGLPPRRVSERRRPRLYIAPIFFALCGLGALVALYEHRTFVHVNTFPDLVQDRSDILPREHLRFSEQKS